ncbi:putative aarF domain-containing protein kinase 1 [Chionoecetes opilio]|uniref:Putative aarF domain-containing protein kinase 1 n=1 Tax=Chionoecetes opilio TaxID=41210 RepID=A0A8J4YFU5_CHIOP|nr:putative aarF domain-containing protein kinase 1 [Chionoecetes opilio]
MMFSAGWYIGNLLRLGLLGVGSGAVTYNLDELETAGIGALRFGRAAVTVTKIVADYKTSLYSGNINAESEEYSNIKSQTHLRAAKKLLDLCCVNGGAFVKVGQHMGSLEYLLPMEYVNTLKVLHSKAPESPLQEIKEVLEEELKCKPEDLFVEFEPKPLGAASLAQVHRAMLHDGRLVAVKIQHPLVKMHSKVDMKGMELLVQAVSLVFPEFDFTWLVEEMKKNLPRELNFTAEAHNAERVAAQFSHLPWLKCPRFHSHRVVLHTQLLALNVAICDLPTLLAAAGVHPSRQHAVIRLTCAFLRKTGQLQRL